MTMSDRPAPPTTQDGPMARTMSIVMPADVRFRVVVETATRIYMRPICRSADQAPEITAALSRLMDEVAGGEPIEVVFACRPPELEVVVASGGRTVSRRWRIVAES